MSVLIRFASFSPFADDMIIFSKDPMELQILLGKLHVYSSEWDLRVIIRIKIKNEFFKSNENIHKNKDGSYYVVAANKALSVTL